MDRRTFLKTGALVPPEVAPVVEPPALVRSIGGVHALELLAELVERTDTEVVSSRIEEWLTTRVDAERAAIQTLNAGMADRGFSDFRDPRVFVNGDAIFYGVGNVDGRNACAPFWVRGSGWRWWKDQRSSGYR